MDVVDLRHEQVDFWCQSNQVTLLLAMQGRYPTPSAAHPLVDAHHARLWMHGTMRDAELYWVAPDMVTLLEAVAPSMPAINPEPPVPEALVVFARPVQGTDAQTGGPIHTAAYLWGDVTIDGARCLELETFGWRDLMEPGDMTAAETEQFRRALRTKLCSTGGSEWPYHEVTDDFTWVLGQAGYSGPPSFSDTQVGSMLEDRRLIAAFWTLCGQRITVEQPQPLDRPVLRRTQRAGLPTRPVRVVTLREASHHPSAAGRPVDWSHRWIVGGHWRQQPYGQGSELRRAQWIAPFVKGPEDKPFVPRETVRALKR